MQVMKLRYETLIHEIRCGVMQYYESLADRLVDYKNTDPVKIKNLVHLEASKIRDNTVVDEFAALVNRFFPDSDSVLQELPRV
jgi:hypothetical protein